MDNTITSDNGGRLIRGVLIPGLVGVLALTVAFVGALIVRDATGVDGINLFVEGLSGRSSSFFGGLGLIAPLGFAFGAGIAAAFNPCGFAMLPAYMGLYLGSNDAEDENRSTLQHMGKAVVVGGAVTAGFVLLFAAAGAIIGLGARSLLGSVLPWMGLAIGVALTVADAWLLSGGKLYSALATKMANRMGDPG